MFSGSDGLQDKGKVRGKIIGKVREINTMIFGKLSKHSKNKSELFFKCLARLEQCSNALPESWASDLLAQFSEIFKIIEESGIKKNEEIEIKSLIVQNTFLVNSMGKLNRAEDFNEFLDKKNQKINTIHEEIKLAIFLHRTIQELLSKNILADGISDNAIQEYGNVLKNDLFEMIDGNGKLSDLEKMSLKKYHFDENVIKDKINSFVEYRNKNLDVIMGVSDIINSHEQVVDIISLSYLDKADLEQNFKDLFANKEFKKYFKDEFIKTIITINENNVIKESFAIEHLFKHSSGIKGIFQHIFSHNHNLKEFSHFFSNPAVQVLLLIAYLPDYLTNHTASDLIKKMASVVENTINGMPNAASALFANPHAKGDIHDAENIEIEKLLMTLKAYQQALVEATKKGKVFDGKLPNGEVFDGWGYPEFYIYVVLSLTGWYYKLPPTIKKESKPESSATKGSDENKNNNRADPHILEQQQKLKQVSGLLNMLVGFKQHDVKINSTFPF